MGNREMNSAEASAELAARAADVMAKATPGPWRFDIRPSYDPQIYAGPTVLRDREFIADVGGDDQTRKQADANAALIAMAPDLAAEIARLTQINAEVTAANAALMVRVEAARAVLANLVQSVCGMFGFAEVVRNITGLAFPWPSLDAAEKEASAWLAGGAE